MEVTGPIIDRCNNLLLKCSKEISKVDESTRKITDQTSKTDYENATIEKNWNKFGKLVALEKQFAAKNLIAQNSFIRINKAKKLSAKLLTAIGKMKQNEIPLAELLKMPQHCDQADFEKFKQIYDKGIRLIADLGQQQQSLHLKTTELGNKTLHFQNHPLHRLSQFIEYARDGKDPTGAVQHLLLKASRYFYSAPTQPIVDRQKRLTVPTSSDSQPDDAEMIVHEEAIADQRPDEGKDPETPINAAGESLEGQGHITSSLSEGSDENGCG